MGENKGKHIDYSKREMIANGIEQNLTAKQIGLLIGVDATSVSREIKRHRVKRNFSNPPDITICRDCMNKLLCTKQRSCSRAGNGCTKRCVSCEKIQKCSAYELMKCKRRERFPFVCNGCSKKDLCPLDKYNYDPRGADKFYRQTLVESRKGINQTSNDFKIINEAVMDGVEKGQSIYHIANSLDEVKVSTSTLYRYIHNEYLTIQIHNLPKVVTLKKRKKKISSQYEYLENKGMDRTGHLHKDWLLFQVRNRIVMFWEMDFLGVPHKSSKMILVLTIPRIQFIMLYAIENANNAKVIEIINNLERELGLVNFQKVFEAVVTDRDCKFNDIEGFEFSVEGEKRTSLFFCDSGMSNQKPNVENINSQLRLFINKKADLSNITQDQCYELASNMNCRLLNSLAASSPMDAFIQLYGEETLPKIHQHKIEPKSVAPKHIIK